MKYLLVVAFTLFSNTLWAIDWSLENRSIEEAISWGQKWVAYKAYLQSSHQVAPRPIEGPISDTWEEFHEHTLSPISFGQLSPIESPAVRKVGSVRRELFRLKVSLPEDLKNILAGQAEFRPLDSEAVHLTEIGTKIEALYENAVRLKFLISHLSYFTENRKRDVRAFLALTKMPNLENKLQHFSELSANQQQLIDQHMPMVCFNASSNSGATALETCRTLWRLAKRNGDHLTYWNNYAAGAQAIYESYFRINEFNLTQQKRIFRYNNETQELSVPFKALPEQLAEFADFFKNLIEESWQDSQLRVSIEYLDSVTRTSKINFRPGALAHVQSNELLIVLDQQENPVVSTSAQVLRHEFGHLLGLPDCYVEFYDEQEEGFVYYELDTSDIMCSLSGQIKQRHLREVQRAYGRIGPF